MTVKGEDCKKQMLEDTSDTTSAPDGQPDILDEEEADNSVDSSCFSGTLQRTFDPEQTAVHGMDGHAENCSGSACSKSQLRRKARMSLWNTEDKLAISQPLLDVDKKMEPPDLSIDALEEDLAPPPIKTSRVHQKPVRGLQQPSVAFFDRTYFQRFQLCCLPAYVGEGSLFVMDCSRMTPNCPKMLAHLQKQQEKLQHKKKTVICSTVLRGDLPSSSPASTCSSDMSDGRTHLIPSPTESSCTNFQFCAVDDGGHATSC
ncbi:hypothetical protein BaRGS_00014178 [Batillaria attramentaria]|uniref:Uncharacterized protein n=1 Tax=Batillaria attramentaria TaxID=370345 RepID=A0ABD0L528_9CAEN